ncbi:CLUMA_CG017594, isoform A, partial [Clunio marinus]
TFSFSSSSDIVEGDLESPTFLNFHILDHLLLQNAISLITNIYRETKRENNSRYWNIYVQEVIKSSMIFCVCMPNIQSTEMYTNPNIYLI